MASTYHCDFCHPRGPTREHPIRLVRLLHSDIVADHLAKLATAIGLKRTLPTPHVFLCEEPHGEISPPNHYRQFCELGTIGKTWYCKNCGTDYYPDATRFAINTITGAFFVDCSSCRRNRMPAEPIVAQEQTLHFLQACTSCGNEQQFESGDHYFGHCGQCGTAVQVVRMVEYRWIRKKVTPIPEPIGIVQTQPRCQACGNPLFSQNLAFCTACGSKQSGKT